MDNMNIRKIFISIIVIIHLLTVSCRDNYKLKNPDNEEDQILLSNYSKLSQRNSGISKKSNSSAKDFYLDQDFIKDLDESIQKSNTYKINLNVLEEIRKYSDSWTNEKKYQTVIKLVKDLPTPYYLDSDSDYKLNYDKLIEYSKKLYRKTSKRVPKNVHFIWLGGKLGNIQKDYIDIWAKLNADDYNVYLWYDSNNINNNSLNKKIKEYLNVFLSGRNKSDNYSELYAEEMIKIQNKLNEFIFKKSKENPLWTNNDIRVNFLKEFYNKKNQINIKELSEVYPENNNFIESVENLLKNNKNIIIKDINLEKNSWTLKENYEQELNLRLNFAAASDSARLEILKKYGGIYMDVDVLPSINKLVELSTIELKGIRSILKTHFKLISYAYYEAIFNSNPEILPSRKNSSENINDLFTLLDSISGDDARILKEQISRHFAYFKNEGELENIFSKLGNIYIRPLELKTSTRNNNFIISHENDNNNNIVNNIIDQIKMNYADVNNYEINNPNFYYQKSSDYDDSFGKSNINFQKVFENSISRYRYDSLLPDSTVTVLVSGPWTYEAVFKANNLKHENLAFITQFNDLNELFNRHTEEDKKSSWVRSSIESALYENVILKLSNDVDSEKAIKYFSNFLNENNERFTIINPKDNKSINLNIERKVNLFIIGKSSKNSNSMLVDKYTAKQISDYLVKVFPKKTQFEFVNLISCNPDKNSNNTEEIEKFGKNILNEINSNDREANLIILRNSLIKLDKNGKEIAPKKFGFYYNGSDDNKIFLIRRSDQEYISLSKELLNKNVTTSIYDDVIKFTDILRTIAAKKTNHLSDFSSTLDRYKYSYRREKEDKRVHSIRSLSSDIEKLFSGSKIQSDKIILNSIISEDELYKLYNLLEKISFNKNDINNFLFDYYAEILSLVSKLTDKYKISNNEFIKIIKNILDENYSFIEKSFSIEIKEKIEKLEKLFINLNLSSNENPILHTLSLENKSIEIYNEKSNKTYQKSLNSYSEDDLISIIEAKTLIDKNCLKYFHDNSHSDSNLSFSGPSVSLSHAYLIKNIIEYFSKRDFNIEDKSKNKLEEILKIHMYTNLSQISTDVIESSIRVSNVIRLINSNEFKNLNSFQTFSKFSAAVGSVLNVANVVFDAAEYHYAERIADKAKFGTQLALDGTSLGLMSTGVILGESVGGVFLSGLGEIFGGLAVGISSYAEIVGDKIDQALKLAKYFKDYENDHYLLKDQDNYFINSDGKVLTFAHKDFTIENGVVNRSQLNTVIEELDFREQSEYKVTFGDHITYPISRHENGKYFYHAFAPNPALIRDASERVKFREALSIPKEVIRKLNNVNKVILPNQVQNLIEYSFMSSPFNLTRNDAEFSTVDKLQSNTKFIFRYTFMHGFGDQSIGGLKFFPQNTGIKIKLNDSNQNLHFITPEIPESSLNRLTYHFYLDESKKNSNYHFFINNKASYIFNNNINDSIHLHIDAKFKKMERISENKFKITTSFSNKTFNNLVFNRNIPQKIYIHDISGITYLVYNNYLVNELNPIFINNVLDYSFFSSKDELQSILHHYHSNTQSLFFTNDQKVKIINYPVDNSENKQTVFYDHKNESYIYTGIKDDNLIYLGKTNGKNLFYNNKSNRIYSESIEILANTEKVISVFDDHFIININKIFNIVSYSYGFMEINFLENSKLSDLEKIDESFLKLFYLVKYNFADSSKFYIPMLKKFFVENDNSATLVSYKILSDNTKSFIIAGKYLYSVNYSENNSVITEKFDIVDPVYLYHKDDYFYFSSGNFIYQAKKSEYNLFAIKSDYLKNYNNKTLKVIFDEMNTYGHNIILRNNSTIYEFRFDEGRIIFSNGNLRYLGTDLNDRNIIYYYDNSKQQFMSTDSAFFNPNNYLIKVEENNIIIENLKPLAWKIARKEKSLFNSLQSSNALNIFKNSDEFFAEKFLNHGCNFRNSAVKSLYEEICSLVVDLNNNHYSLINAYSRINKSTIMFSKNQASFRMFDNESMKFLYKNSPYEYWGAGNWLSSELPYTTTLKHLAIGGFPTSLGSLFSDVYFIDKSGNLLKPYAEIGATKKFVIEKQFKAGYVNEIFSAFILNDNYHSYLVFLKKNGFYDLLSMTDYTLVKTGLLKDLFHGLPSDYIIDIDQVIKLESKVILLKKQKLKNRYDKAIIVDESNLLRKNAMIHFEEIDIN